MSARIHETQWGYMYEIDGVDLPLNQDTYQAYEHRSTAHSLMDWVGVLDPRDDQHFSHFRYDQPPEAFTQMMMLAKMIGTYVLMDTPYAQIQDMFDRGHELTEQDWTEIEGTNE